MAIAYRPWRTFLETSKRGLVSGVLLGLLGCCRPAGPAGPTAATIPAVDDAGLLRLYAPPRTALPPRLFTPAVIERLRQRQPTLVDSLFDNNAGLGQKAAAQIPPDRWREFIPPYTAFTMRCGSNQNIKDSGRCPFCGATYGGTVMTPDDFFAHPFQAKTACCGAIIYEREADMPPDYKARPNHTAQIPNLDGTSCAYRFYVPPGTENAGPEIGSDRRHWFCSASEVWWAREKCCFCTENPDSIVNALAAAVVLGRDDQAARSLAIIYDRLAEVLPAYQLMDNGGSPNGLARGADGNSYLTSREYHDTPVPAAWQKPAWLRIPPYYNLGKMNHASGWQDGVMANTGSVAAIFDLIRDHPAVRAYSRERYQDETAWEKRVRHGVLDELHVEGLWSTPGRGGNVSYGWIIGALRLGLVTQDRYFLDTAIEMVDRVIDNHYFADGTCVEGAYDYAAMMAYNIRLTAVLEDSLGIDLTARHALMPVIASKGGVTTLYGIESMHADEHAYFFTGNGTGWKTPPAKVDYSAHEIAQCDPIYGLACLRAGQPGRRLETIMDFQTAKAHVHPARLNIQAFYEGVNLLPDVGYACVSVDVTRPPWSTISYPFAKLPLPPGTDFWGAWYTYGGRPEIHCTALVDGQQAVALEQPGTATLQRFLGGDKLGEPGYNAQLIDVDGHGLFTQCQQPPTVFQRQLVAVTLADGRPLALDFFRLRGGRRHDLFWHAPATGPEAKLDTSLGAATPLSGSLNGILNQANPERSAKSAPDTGSDLFRRLGRWEMPTGAWQVTFPIEPAHFNPVTPGGQKLYEPWMKVLHNVNLHLWGAVAGSTAITQEILCARAPWPSKVREVFAGQESCGTVSLKDAFHVLDESRTGRAGDLSTTYAHVLDPCNPDQTPTVQNMEIIAPDDAASPALGVGVRVTTTASNALWVATTAGGGEFSGGRLRLQGRLGVAEPAAWRLTLFDGTAFAIGGLGVKLEAGWNLKLLGVVGDLTGHSGESALIVESGQPLPTDRTLAGRMLTVQHQISRCHSTGYTIERVSTYGPHRYRIDLRDVPTFLVNRLAVAAVGPANPHRIKVDYWLLKGDNEKGLYDGRLVRFPRQQFQTTMILPPGQDPWHHAHIQLAQVPPEKIQTGDPVVLYDIQPGDQVVIPSHFACQGTETAAGLKLEIEATGAATLTVPGRYTNATLLLGFTQAPVTMVKPGPGNLQIQLGRQDLVEGRATLLLTH